MNYSHSYHAGNFSDVFKHIVLIALMKSMLQKDKAFCCLDTHSGPGYYDLFSEAAQKNKEHEAGLGKLLQKKNLPELVRLYLNCIRRVNNRLTHSIVSSLRYYPGSPAIMRYFLRVQDRMVLSELHPKEFQTLKSHFEKDIQVSLQCMDGYQGLKAFLPPKERRGLVLIDPPYERPSEFTAILHGLTEALKRFPTGVYAIWYPIKDRSTIDRFYRSLKEITQRPLLAAEMILYPESSPLLLNGCGMAFINPPWLLDKQIEAFLPWLCKSLSQQDQGISRIFSP